MYKLIFEKFLQQFIKAVGRKPQTTKELMSIQDDVVRYLNKTKGVPEGPKKPPFQGFTPKVIEGGKSKKGIGTLFKDSPERIAKMKADNKAAAERLRKKKMEDRALEDFTDDFTDDPEGLASGGMARVGYAGGGKILKWLLSLGNKKPNSMFEIEELARKKGIIKKDEVITTDEVFNPKTRKDTTEYNVYKKSDKNRPPTADEIDDYMEELPHGDGEMSWHDFGNTVDELDKAVADHKAYLRQMMDDYKTGKLDKYMSMEAKGKRVLDADDAGRPSGYSLDEEYEIRSAMDEAENLAVEKYENALELEKSKKTEFPTLENQMDYPLSPEEIKGKKLADSMSDAEIELRDEFPGITDEMINNILTDKNPQRIAEVKQTMREAFKMQEKGMSPDEIIKMFKDTSRTKQASGGIAGQLHMNRPGYANGELAGWEFKTPDKKLREFTPEEIEQQRELIRDMLKKQKEFYEDQIKNKDSLAVSKKIPEEQPPFQGPPYETNNPNEAGKEILRRILGGGHNSPPIGGGFNFDVPYGAGKPYDYGIQYQPGGSDFLTYYGIQEGGDNVYGGGYQGKNFGAGVKKQEGGEPEFTFGFKKKLKKKKKPIFGKAKGGLAHILGV